MRLMPQLGGMGFRTMGIKFCLQNHFESDKNVLIIIFKCDINAYLLKYLK